MNENIENAVLKEAQILPEAELQEEVLWFDEIELPVQVIGNNEGAELIGTPEQVQKLFEAWSKYLAVVTNPVKDKDNPFFRSKYSDLASVLDATRKVLAENGLGVMQWPEYINGDGVHLHTMVTHSAGGAIVFPSLNTPMTGKVDSQQIGSVTTYSRRCALNAVLFVAGDPDDDGNTASGKGTGTTTKKPKASKSDVDPALAEARAKLLDLCKKRSGEVADKEEIYKVIVKYCGNRNPNVMQSVEDCTAATEEIKKLK